MKKEQTDSSPTNSRQPVHPAVSKHIQVLEEYFKLQKQLFSLTLPDNQPQDEFEANSHYVLIQELNRQSDTVTHQMQETLMELTKIPY